MQTTSRIDNYLKKSPFIYDCIFRARASLAGSLRIFCSTKLAWPSSPALTSGSGHTYCCTCACIPLANCCAQFFPACSLIELCQRLSLACLVIAVGCWLFGVAVLQEQGEGNIRISYVRSMDILKEGLDRIETCLAELPAK